LNQPCLLITRPADEAARTVAAVEAAGFAAMEAPLLSIEPLDAVLPAARPDAILFTSPRAPERLAALAPGLKACPAITVGPRSSEAAVRAGFRVVAEGQGDGSAALRLAAGQGYYQLLHPRGEDHVALDAVPGVKLLPVIVYGARAESALAAPAVQALASGDIFATLLLSPRTAVIFAQLALKAGLHRRALRLVVLSPQVADAAGSGWQAAAVAAQPRLSEALAAARRLWQGSAHA
jgi:uroporphyrinogen-III synthase